MDHAEDLTAARAERPIRWLRWFAVADLIGGIVGGAVLVLGALPTKAGSKADAVAIGVGVAVIAQGVFLWAALSVLALMAESLRDIVHNTWTMANRRR